MDYRLVIDVGNTSRKFAIFRERNLTVIHKAKNEVEENAVLQKLNLLKVKSCIVSASGQISISLYQWLESKDFTILYFTSSTSIPLSIKYDTPETLGKDRIAGAIASLHYFPKGDTITIDMGTCITMNVIDDTPAFLGGNISPGLTMRLRAMHEFTAQLPMVEKKINETLIGSNTQSALQNGAILGAFWEIESFIHKIQSKNKEVNVILTGGDADFFVSYTNIKIFATPNLVLEGLNEILIFNAL
ncbi:MAG: type III pantothenate kinase [Saprospiraceae bacterium]